MADDFVMRLRLQSVVAYRDICRAVQRSGRENVGFALLMLFLAYLMYENGAMNIVILLLYGILVVGELLVGFFKWVFPSAEGVLLDALVLLVFAAINLGLQVVRFQLGVGLDVVALFLGLFLLSSALRRIKSYRQLRAIFPERPSAEQIAWFDELIAEIRAADPQSDELALDLPTRPHWKAKLLGNTAFFVAIDANPVWIAGPDDFEILREKMDHGTGRRKALLRIHGQPFPEFPIADASWANYQKWRVAFPLPSL